MTERPLRLYTRTGDTGTTGLMGRGRRPKESLRIQVLGEVDELNSHLGVVRALNGDAEIDGLLREIQARLFELGSELAQPAASRLLDSHVTWLEQRIDRIQDAVPPLTCFVLPGGTPAAAHCHLARTVCRRAERQLFRLARHESVNAVALQYANRLSDLLFVMARLINHQAGAREIPWQPQDDQQPQSSLVDVESPHATQDHPR